MKIRNTGLENKVTPQDAPFEVGLKTHLCPMQSGIVCHVVTLLFSQGINMTRGGKKKKSRSYTF